MLNFRALMRPSLVTLLLAIAAVGCKKDEPAAAAPTATAPAAAPAEARKLQRSDVSAFGALPENFDNAANPPSDAKIALGQQLFFEARLSKNQQISCNSCHNLSTFGVDNKATSTGHKGQLGGRNSPTVLNAAGEFVQFWDGRAPDVEAQAKGPILNPVEMAMASSETVIATLKSMPEYVTAFQAAFPGEADALTYDNLGKAIGAFERRLVTKSRWDKYLAGDDAALTDEEKDGALTFVTVGCVGCHNGVLVGGAVYQKAGLVKPWENQKDLGRFEITKKNEDKLFFKVPTLRNIAKTAPYFHDGSAATLNAAIKTMAEHQLGKQLTDAQVASIAKFLDALTGQVPPGLVQAPKLPASTETTPKAILD